MMMMMKLVVAVSCVVAASFLVAAADASHYEKPPCGSDEKAVQIVGVNGIFCSPECTPTGACPTDVPAGVVAVRIILIISPIRGTNTSTLSLARSLMLVILFSLVFLIHSHPFSILSGGKVRYEYSRLIHALDLLSLFVFPCVCVFFCLRSPTFIRKPLDHRNRRVPYQRRPVKNFVLFYAVHVWTKKLKRMSVMVNAVRTCRVPLFQEHKDLVFVTMLLQQQYPPRRCVGIAIVLLPRCNILLRMLFLRLVPNSNQPRNDK